MALPDFTTQDATTYKTAIDDTAQDHDSRIEQNEMDIADHGTRLTTVENDKLDASRFPNVDGNVTASDEEINKLDGVTASTAEINYLDDFYEETTLPLDGDFYDGDLYIARMGNVVTVTLTEPSFASASTVSTSSGFVPSHLRPVEDVFGVYFMSGGGLIMARLHATGTFTIEARDYSGTPRDIAGVQGFSTSYITNYGWPSS